MKVRCEVEYDDDGAAMAGANYNRTIRRAQIVEVEVERPEEVTQAVMDYMSKRSPFITVRRVFPYWDVPQH